MVQTDARSDQELIAAINHGDAAAFEVLYFRYRYWVAGLAYRFTGDSDTALDVLQETFLYFLKKFPGFRLTANLKTFLYPAVKNLSLTAIRKRERYQSSEADQAQVDRAAAPDGSELGADTIAQALAGLPEEQREVLLLRFVEDLALQDIAQAMAIPLGTVKSRLHNALQALRAGERTKEIFGR